MPNMFDVTSPRLIALKTATPQSPQFPTQQLNTHNALPEPDIHG